MVIYKETSLSWLDVDLPTQPLSWEPGKGVCLHLFGQRLFLVQNMTLRMYPRHKGHSARVLWKASYLSGEPSPSSDDPEWEGRRKGKEDEREPLERQWMWLWGAKGGTEHSGGSSVESDWELQIPFVKHFLQMLKLFSFRAVGAYVKNYAVVNYKHKCSHQIQLAFKGEGKREEGNKRETVSP